VERLTAPPESGPDQFGPAERESCRQALQIHSLVYRIKYDSSQTAPLFAETQVDHERGHSFGPTQLSDTTSRPSGRLPCSYCANRWALAGMKNQFEDVSIEGRRVLRAFLGDTRQLQQARSDFRDMEALARGLRALPIYESFKEVHQGGDAKERFSPLQEGQHFQAPTSVDGRLLDTGSHSFIRSAGANDERLLEVMGVSKIALSHFYRGYFLNRLADLEPEVRTRATVGMLAELEALQKEDPELLTALKDTAFVPSGGEGSTALFKPSDLYDPLASDLQQLLDRDAFPAREFCNPEMVHKLRRLGLRGQLSLPGMGHD
jgi:hypothetical protein